MYKDNLNRRRDENQTKSKKKVWLFYIIIQLNRLNCFSFTLVLSIINHFKYFTLSLIHFVQILHSYYYYFIIIQLPCSFFNNFIYQVLSIQQMLNNVGLHFNINLKAQNVPLWPTKTSLKSPKRATLATKNIISFKLTFL